MCGIFFLVAYEAKEQKLEYNIFGASSKSRTLNPLLNVDTLKMTF